MQVNARVWRGLYDQHGLRWDIVYNARAGADNLARSAYAAYNGGPSQYARYRRATAAAGVDVDAVFYEKYRQIKGGNDLAVTTCFAGA